MKNFILSILILACIQSALSFAYEPKLLWTKYIGSQPGAAVITNDDKFIYCTEGSNLYKLDIDSGTILKHYNIGASSLRISKDDKILYMGTSTGLYVFDLVQEKVIRRMDSTVGITSLDISPDNSKLCYWTYYNSSKDSIKIYNLPDFKQVQAFRYPQFSGTFNGIMKAKFLPDGNRIVWWPLYSADQPTSNIDIYDITQNQIVSSIKDAHTAYINDIAVSSDGNFIASAGSNNDRFLKVWDVNTKQTIFKKYINREILKIIFSKVNNIIITGSDYDPVSLWDFKDNILINTIDEPGRGCCGLTISNDNKKVLLISDEVHLFSINFDSLVGVNEQIIPDPNTIYPNPVTNIVNLTFNVPVSNNYKISLNNINGSLERTLFNDYLNSGNNTKIFNVADLLLGTYLISISSNNFSKTYKLIKER